MQEKEDALREPETEERPSDGQPGADAPAAVQEEGPDCLEREASAQEAAPDTQDAGSDTQEAVPDTQEASPDTQEREGGAEGSAPEGKRKKRRRWLRLLLLIPAALILLCAAVVGTSALVCSTCLSVKEYEVRIDGIDRPFTAVLLTDLHSKEYGRDNRRLLARVRSQDPDVIFAVGDLINEDADDEEVERYLALLERLGEIAPVYVSYGNHELEYMRKSGVDLAPLIARTGAILLNEEWTVAEIAGNRICLGGTMGHLYPFGRTNEEFFSSPEFRLVRSMQSSGLPTVMLSHLPDTIIFVHAYEVYDIDLFLSGHTHGGVIRIPGKGGLYAPMQGKFPEYDRGYFHPGKVQLIVSGGLAGHGRIPRIFNMPEISVIHFSG